MSYIIILILAMVCYAILSWLHVETQVNKLRQEMIEKIKNEILSIQEKPKISEIALDCDVLETKNSVSLSIFDDGPRSNKKPLVAVSRLDEYNLEFIPSNPFIKGFLEPGFLGKTYDKTKTWDYIPYDVTTDNTYAYRIGDISIYVDSELNFSICKFKSDEQLEKIISAIMNVIHCIKEQNGFEIKNGDLFVKRPQQD